MQAHGNYLANWAEEAPNVRRATRGVTFLWKSILHGIVAQGKIGMLDIWAVHTWLSWELLWAEYPNNRV